MKKKILFLIVVLASRGLAGQTLSPKVIPSGGEYGLAAGYSYSFTIGEPDIQYLQSAAALEEGFQHGELDIVTGAISGSPFCPGAAVIVPFTATGIFNTDNVFTAQLSDASGNFASAVPIGVEVGVTSGSISATMPFYTVSGTGYRIRVTGSDIQLNGTDNGSDIIINAAPTPTITGPNPLVCEGNQYRYHTEEGMSGYTWTVSSGGNISGNATDYQILVNWTSGGAQTVIVNYTSGGCSSVYPGTVYNETVNSNANISLQPSPVTISAGKNIKFNITSDPTDNTGLTYQWQVNEGSWNNITSAGSNPAYSGFTTATLSLTGVVSGNNGYLYRCVVISTCSANDISSSALLTVTAPTAGLWDGASSADWSTGSNWDDGNVPIGTTNVVIPSSAPNQPILTNSGQCNNITIDARASLSVTGGILQCNGNVQILSNNTGTGAFTQSDAASVSITGTVTVQRYLSNLGYHYLASPLQSVTCNALSGFGGMTYTGGGTWYDPNHPAAIVPYPNMWRIDESHTHSLCPSDYNSWYAPAKSEIMSTGLGYAINVATGAKTISVSNPGSDLNAGTYTASVSKEALSTNTIYNNDMLDQYGIINGAGAQNVGTGPTNGWHLIGNPYPSPVDWNALVNGGGVGTNIGYGISFFKPTTQWTGVYGSYYYNTAHITSSSGAFNPGRYIPSMQSFFIQNNVVSTPVLTFKNAYRNVTSSALNANFYRSDEGKVGVGSSEIPNIALYGYQQSTDNSQQSIVNLKDKAVIMFGAQDTDFGTSKLMNTDDNVPNIYSKGLGSGLGSGEELSIQGISELKSDMIIPLGFDVNTSGNYTINAGEILNFPTGTHIYLEDLKNKVAQDLTINPNYSFAISKGDADNRFFLKFAQSLQSNASSAEMFDAYSIENVLVVNYNNPSNEQAVLNIFNVIGQNVREWRIENGELRITPNVAPGAYVVRLVTNDRVYVKKVYIQ